MPPRSPPSPVSATYAQNDQILRVVFDRFLEDGPLDQLNWWVRASNSKRTGLVPAFAHNKVVTCPVGFPVINPGADACFYVPPPFDVRSRHDLPAAAFAEFPMTLLP